MPHHCFRYINKKLKRKAVIKGMRQSFHGTNRSRVNKSLCEYMCMCVYERHLRTVDNALKGWGCLWGSPTKLHHSTENTLQDLWGLLQFLLLNLLTPYPFVLVVFPCKPIIQVNKTIKPINLTRCLTNLVPSVLHTVANFRFPYHGCSKSVPDSLCHIKYDLVLCGRWVRCWYLSHILDNLVGYLFQLHRLYSCGHWTCI